MFSVRKLPRPWWALGIVAALSLIIPMAVGAWGAHRMLWPGRPRPRIRVHSVVKVGERRWVELDRNRLTEAAGHFSLRTEEGVLVPLGHVVRRAGNRVHREICVTSDDTLRVPGQAIWTGVRHRTPADIGLDYWEVDIDTTNGSCPAWLIPGDPDTWAVHIHGLGSSRASTLRGISDRGLLQSATSLVVSYRGDGEGPDGPATLGLGEADDVEQALLFAVRNGAKRFMLVGWSMGGTIALIVSSRLAWRERVVAMVLDSPVLDWKDTLRSSFRRAGLPAALEIAASTWMRSPLVKLLGGDPIDHIDLLQWRHGEAGPTAPTLIVHGTADTSCPIATSERFASLFSGVVTLEVTSGGHTTSWNTNPKAWASTVDSWLEEKVGCSTQSGSASQIGLRNGQDCCDGRDRGDRPSCRTGDSISSRPTRSDEC